MKTLFTSFLRRTMFCLLLTLLFCLSAMTVRANTATAVYNKNTKTLTFYMLSDQELNNILNSSAYRDCVWTGDAVLNQGLYSTNISWSNYKKEMETVVFDSSFSAARPRFTSYWFSGCSALTSIKGISYVNTTETIDMRSMFANCTSLTRVDLSTFNAGNVEYMINLFSGCTSLTSVEIPYNTVSVKSIEGMFKGCSSLTTVDLSRLKTTSLTNMSSLFTDCRRLEKVDFSSVLTSGVTDMNSMFRGCGSLQELDLSNLNTSSVQNMSYMFFQCAMPSIDVSNFDVSSVQKIDEMFSQNSSLRKIYCDKAWRFSSPSILFFNCPSLSGAIMFDRDKYSSLFANTTTGYFTPTTFSKSTPCAVWCSDNATLYFASSTTAYRIGDKFEDGTITDFWWCDQMLDNSAVGYPVWNMPSSTVVRNNVKNVVFTESFRQALPKSMKRWFSDFKMLMSVKGLANLNAADVTDMDSLFTYCVSLSEMEGLATLNTSSVTNMNHMFYECRNLPEIDVSNFNTANVTDMSSMFNYCQSVKALDVGSFNTSKVKDFSKMFAYCTSLETIFCDNTWDAATLSKDMFYRCEKLKGKIPYDSWNVDANYANPITGYFTGVDKYNLWICGTQVTSLNCNDLTVIEGVSTTADGSLFSYDPTNNTLLMKGVNIISENEVALHNGIKDLHIQSEGDGNLLRSDYGKAAFVIDARTYMGGSTVIVLGGTLTQQTTMGMCLGHVLRLENAKVLAAGTKGIAGDVIYDNGTPTYYGALSVTGSSVVYAYGKDAAISDLSTLTLGKYGQIVDPADAVFDRHAVRLNGDVVTGAVTIMCLIPGDVNLDGEVNISDVVAVINTMAGDTTYIQTADVNGDNAVNISDVVSVINIMAGV